MFKIKSAPFLFACSIAWLCHMSSHTVIATFNNSNENLLKLKNNNLKIYKCDQSNIENINSLKDYVNNIPINIIINNAGVWGGINQSFNEIDYENFQEAININAVSVLKPS